MQLKRAGSQPSTKGPADFFTGTVRIDPHWHGATPTTAMTHIAIQESIDGMNVDWLEKVTDAEYLAAGNRHEG